MKWVKEFASTVIFRIRFRKSTLLMLMAQLQGTLPGVDNASKNTKKNTESKNKKNKKQATKCTR